MAGMAASTSLFRRNIDGADHDLLKFDKTTQDVGRSIDKLSGRLGLALDVAATLGPAIIPTLAQAVPLLAGLTNQLGFAAIAGGSTILAFQGIGDALKALNEQQLHPSAANLEKLHEAMATLGPAGKDFVRELQAMRPELQKLQNVAQAGLFPGMTQGIESLLTRMPQAERIIGEVTDTVGGLLAQAGKSLAGHQWDAFFNMLESEARPTLQDLGESIGQVTKGLADLWVAFAPLNRDFSKGMLGASKSFADWAQGLSQTQGFADFVAYLQQTGPQVAQALGAISKALVDVLVAASPLGGPALKAITAFANAISAIAKSDLGTPIFAAIAAWRAYSLAVGLAERAQMRFNASSAVGGRGAAKGGIFSGYTSSLLGVTSAQERAQTAAGKTSETISRQRGAFLKGAAGAALLGVAMTGAADKFGAANTATLALAGSMLGPWGAAAGAGVGAFLDLKSAGESFGQTLDRLNLASKSGNITAISKEIAKAKAQIDDINHTSGVGDFFSDIGKTKGASLAGLLPGASISSDKADDAISNAKRAESIAKITAATKAAATASQLAANGFRLTAAGAREAGAGVEAFAFAVRGANAALTRQGTLDAYRSSLLDLKDALKANGQTLATNTRAGLANRAALRAIASSALDAAGNMKNFAHRTEFLQGARKSFINAATAAGMTRKAAKALADQLGLVSRIKATPKITLNGAERSIAQARAVRAAIAAIQSKSVTITTIERRRAGAPASVTMQADGGYISGPGGPRDDAIPAYLSNGEFVVNAAATARNLSLLHSINAQRFAGGGEVRKHPNRHDNDPTPHVNKFAQALREATKSLNREKSARDALISKRSDLAGNVRDQFLTDPFGASNVWAPGGGNPAGILKADIAKANAFKSSLAQLRKNGLSGDALASIASTGDIGKAQALLAGGKAGVSQYGSLFNQRAHAAAAVGAFAGNAAYGAPLATTAHQVTVLNAQVKHLTALIKHQHAASQKNHKANADHTGKAVAKGVNSAAASGKRKSRRG